MRKLKIILIISVVLCTTIFAIQNSATVEINFLFWSFASARVFMIFALLGIGFFLGSLATSLWMLEKKK